MIAGSAGAAFDFRPEASDLYDKTQKLLNFKKERHDHK